MTTEEKAQAYDEAKARMSRAWNDNRCTLGFMNEIFPELKESEDERIRKRLVEEMRHFQREAAKESCDADFEFAKSAIAWLEKQGEENPLKGTLGDVFDDLRAGLDPSPKQGEQKADDKAKPKFKVGDWITNGIFNARIIRIREDTYSATTESGDIYFPSYKDMHDYHLWTIEDAKDGDVLQLGSVTAIFKEYIGNKHCLCYCSFCNGGDFEKPIANGEDNNYDYRYHNTTPATKEQRDLLFQKMKEAGYEWNAEKKELRKIEQKPVPKFKVGDIMRTLQEAADGIIDGMPVVVSIDDEYYRCNNELIAIKDQDDYEYPPMNRRQKPWSEEDERTLNNLVNLIHGGAHLAYEEEINWLKSLCPQNRWKPSDEQMEALELVVQYHAFANTDNRNKIVALFNDLKKLKGE